MKQSRRYKTTRHQKRNRRKRRWQLFRRITAITFLLFFLAILTVSALLYDDIHDLYVSAEEKIASINVGTFKNKTETKLPRYLM
ncbi:hypothetical protein P5F75_01770, partial [Caldifermentibacillus hisashii]|uniref:hypothetical protein n=1 Tax=Caldifermentibacillus hisashii TaxID=996558 RepID=UPI002E23E816|nr:hypothetical protein [Caldifermentibacillus hisashii]